MSASIFGTSSSLTRDEREVDVEEPLGDRFSEGCADVDHLRTRRSGDVRQRAGGVESLAGGDQADLRDALGDLGQVAQQVLGWVVASAIGECEAAHTRVDDVVLRLQERVVVRQLDLDPQRLLHRGGRDGRVEPRVEDAVDEVHLHQRADRSGVHDGDALPADRHTAGGRRRGLGQYPAIECASGREQGLTTRIRCELGILRSLHPRLHGGDARPGGELRLDRGCQAGPRPLGILGRIGRGCGREGARQRRGGSVCGSAATDDQGHERGRRQERHDAHDGDDSADPPPARGSVRSHWTGVRRRSI